MEKMVDADAEASVQAEEMEVKREERLREEE